MIKTTDLSLSPEKAADRNAVLRQCARRSGLNPKDITGFRFLSKSVDARKRGNIKVNLRVEFWTAEHRPSSLVPEFKWKNVGNAPEVLIVGSGPAGLFAALELISCGLRPVILERGVDVLRRKKDIALTSRAGSLNPESNYCFGEGGAGTFSDGKLYTRSKKRGDNRKVLELFCYHGASDSILYEAHPHIGTDKLPAVISSVRKTITSAGGIFLFNQRVSDLIISGNRMAGVKTADGESFSADNVVLASGHSARDMYCLLEKRNITLERKAFAMGVRVEHPQQLIDRIQYHGETRGEFLPAAAYSLVAQCAGRGVYSFCMCPGGFIVPAATSPDQVVVNGMSPSHRNSPYANSGIIVEIKPEDIPGEFAGKDNLAGIRYQEWLENQAFLQGNRTQAAPAQRLTDFMCKKMSPDLPCVSYVPGVVSSPLDQWLPPFISTRLQEAFKVFDSRMKGFITEEAVVTAVESRSSSPVRILRDPGTLEHVTVKGLYPAGEGAGYAGGILSCAVDGIRIARAIADRRALS